MHAFSKAAKKQEANEVKLEMKALVKQLPGKFFTKLI